MSSSASPQPQLVEQPVDDLSSSDSVLLVEGLNVSAGRTPIVRDLTFSIRRSAEWRSYGWYP
jgi:hypothetical protein